MRQRSAVVKIALAVLGGWLAIMPASVLTIALRFREFDASGLPSQYSATLALGWLVLIAGLIGFGQAGDALERRGRSRILLVRWAVPLVAISGIALAVASTPTELALAWTIAQLATAATVTSALALSGSTIQVASRGLLSGLIGAASIVALLIGSVVVRALQHDLALAFIACAAVGAVLATPLALRPPVRLDSGPNIDRRHTASTHRRWLSAWALFTAASFLLSWTTSTTNSYVVLFVENVSATSAADVANVATRAVTFATIAAIIASILGGLVMRGRRSAAIMWSAAAVVVALALVGLLARPSEGGIVGFATLFGAGFGLANGVELGLLLFLRHSPGKLGRDLGIFNSMTAVPYVLVPGVATAWLAGDPTAGVRGIFALASILGLVAAVITAPLARTRQTLEASA